MTRLEQYDLALDHLVSASKVLNDFTVDAPAVAVPTLVLDRYREMITTEITLAYRMLQDYADLNGLFKPSTTP